MFILILLYRYDRVTASLWIGYSEILLGEGLQLAFVHLQIIMWLRNAIRLSNLDFSHGMAFQQQVKERLGVTIFLISSSSLFHLVATFSRSAIWRSAHS
jgi:hypothetical protein